LARRLSNVGVAGGGVTSFPSFFLKNSTRLGWSKHQIKKNQEVIGLHIKIIHN
jgi:hypothetical protein